MHQNTLSSQPGRDEVLVCLSKMKLFYHAGGCAPRLLPEHHRRMGIMQPHGHHAAAAGALDTRSGWLMAVFRRFQLLPVGSTVRTACAPAARQRAWIAVVKLF